MWYVVQVNTGHEVQAKQLIDRFADGQGLKECFVPQYETMKHFRGEWRPYKAPLFPGYLIVISNDVEALERDLRKVPTFTRLLGNDDMFIPLAPADQSWIEEFTESNHRVVSVSEGIIEGDEITITSGPLMHHTGWIRKIDRHKRLAYLEIQMFGRTITTKVGLNLVRKATT